MFPSDSHLLKAMGHKPGVPLTDIGNASVDPGQEEFTNRFCMTPDYPDREIAEADVADLVAAFEIDEDTCSHLKEMHRRFIASTGSGSWPPGTQCHPVEYPHAGYHATKVYVDYTDFMQNSSLNREVTDDEWKKVVVDARVWPSVERPVTSVDDAKRTFVYADKPRADRAGRQVGDVFNCLDMGRWLAFEATRRIGVFLIEMFDGPNGDHRIHVRTYPMPGSLSGLGYFPDGTCGDHVTCNIDSLNTYSLGRFAGLLTHELGHCINFRHEFASPQSGHRSIMSYAQDNSPFQGYRKSGAPYQYVADHSWPEARRFFGGEAAKAIGEDVDPGAERLVLDPLLIETVDGQPIITNEFTVHGRTFIIVPKPQPFPT